MTYPSRQDIANAVAIIETAVGLLKRAHPVIRRVREEVARTEADRAAARAVTPVFAAAMELIFAEQERVMCT